MCTTLAVPILQIHLSLDVSTPDLEERIARTLAAFRRHFNVIVWGENPDDDVVYDVEALTASQRMRVAERTMNAAELVGIPMYHFGHHASIARKAEDCLWTAQSNGRSGPYETSPVSS